MGHASLAPGLIALAVLAACALVAMLFSPRGALAGTDNVILTVNLTSDESDANTADKVCDADLVAAGAQCTLRAATQQANAFAGTDADLIRFNIPGGGVHRIAPSAPLPEISGRTSIDGYSQPGASANTWKLRRGDNAEIRIELSGRNLDPFTDNGLTFAVGSSDSVVRGLCINRFATGLVLRTPTTVGGNFIGTDPTGTKDRGNAFDGIFAGTLLGSRTIGGPDPASRNVISANDRGAIVSNVTMHVQGNYIGTASNGMSPLGNKTNDDAEAAVVLAGGPALNIVGGSGGGANVIAFNGGKGIAVTNSNTVAQISRNRIFENRRIAIDLGDDGRTPNDPGDADMGPNRLLNFPVLKRAVADGTRTTITGVYRSSPAQASYGIELFANPPDTRQAKRFIGYDIVETDSTGEVKFTLKTERISPGMRITATATDDGGATSEVSDPVTVR